MYNIPKGSEKGLFEKAKAALEKRNYDYAIALLLSYIKTKPEVLEPRKMLRLAQMQKAEGKDLSQPLNKILSILTNIPGYIKVFLLIKKENWLELSLEIESLLTNNPHDYFLLSKLSAVFEKLEFLELAIDSYKQVLAVDKRNIVALRALARIHKDKMEEFGEAKIYCEKILTVIPHDMEAERMIKDMAAIGTMKKGWEDTTSYRDKIKDVDKAQVFEQEAKAVKSEKDMEALIKDSESKLKETPDNVAVLRSLGDLYGQVLNFDKAEEILKKAIELSPADAAIKKQLVEMKQKWYAQEINNLSRKLEKDIGNKELQEYLNKLVADKENFEIEELKKGAEMYPTDMDIRFELGLKYINRGLINEAISAFQMAAKSPSKKAMALNYLGICFRNKKMYDLAKDQLLKAVSELTVMNELKKEVVYNLGLVYEDLGDFKAAVGEYKKIYEVDISFKDVTKKIESSYNK